MIASALDRAVLSSRLGQVAQLVGTYDSKTDQTAQSDQRVGNAEQFGAPPDQEPTTLDRRLTSGTAQRSNSDVQIAGARLESARARPNDGAPHS